MNRPLWNRASRCLIAVVMFALTASHASLAQLPTSEERLKVLTDPEQVKKKVEKDRNRAPIELFRTQVAPFDILPYVKANHWTTLTSEVRSNYDDFDGWMQTAPVRMLGLSQDIVYRRDSRLLKTQRSRLSLQAMLPTVPRELAIEMLRPDAIRPEDAWPATLRILEPHQMLVLILTKSGSDSFAPWNRFQSLYPLAADRSDLLLLERARYFRFVTPLEEDRPPISSHPLTWTTISHVIWDGFPPDTLNPQQQQAMLDWLHWGGQLTLIGGPGPSFSILKDSFLANYLPAEPTGENVLLNEDDLKPLSLAYPPPIPSTINDEYDEQNPETYRPLKRISDRYLAPAPIRPAPDRPVYLAGLKPNPGAQGIPLGESGERLLGVEQRVGRGRILMLGLSPTDPALATWPGLDTLVRRVLLRRPEEGRQYRADRERRGESPNTFASLAGTDLTWYRLLSRDMGGWSPRPKPPRRPGEPGYATPGTPVSEEVLDPVMDYVPNDRAVGEWLDSAYLPRTCRTILDEASGIKIPSADFVMKIALAYVLALVPLNWLICRYIVRRREIAWIIMPMLAVAFAVGVERAAAYDLGYNSACDEIDVLELHGGYPRGHLTRFASLYSTGRTRYDISFPNDPTALALPLDNGRSLRGEDVVTSTWQSYPTPALLGFLVQPRSLGMFRAEQLVDLDGAISLESSEASRRVVNGGTMELRDAVVVEHLGSGKFRETYLGTLAPGAEAELREAPRQASDLGDAAALGHARVLKDFREYYEDRPENRGELRLVAWTPGPRSGPSIEPAVDRHRGFTAVVVHLTSGSCPSPDGPTYNSLVRKEDRAEVIDLEPESKGPSMPGFAPGALRSNMMRRGGRVAPVAPNVAPATPPAP